jgi:hypothetical protein
MSLYTPQLLTAALNNPWQKWNEQIHSRQLKENISVELIIIIIIIIIIIPFGSTTTVG